jgi:hypothetical protein
MKAATTKRLEKAILRLEAIHAEMDALYSEIESDFEEMQSAHDEKSERWQESEKGEQSQLTLDGLQGVLDEVGELRDTADSAANNLRDTLENA